jgi:4-amino-4-deoxy-L-arabinose transferase-like glycosyltransferase
MVSRGRRYRRLALVIFAAAIALRAGLVERQGLWVDEVFSLAMATGHSIEHPAAQARPELGDYVESTVPRPPSAYRAYAEHEHPPAGPGRVIRAVLLSETSPPLYPLLLYAWTLALGTGDAALRSFSIFWAAASFPLVWALARQLGGRQAALAAVILFAFSPLSVFYTTEGRMYSLLLFFTLGSAEASYRLHRRGTSPSRFGWWVLASAGGLMTHYFFLFVWLAFVAWLFLCPGRTRRATVVAAAAAVALLIAPWYARLPELLAGWRVTRGWLEMRPKGYHPAGTLAKLAWSFVSPTGMWWGPTGLLSRLLVHAPVALSIAAAVALGRCRLLARRRAALVWSWLGAALLGPLAFDLMRGTYTISVVRYAFAGLPAALLLIALALRSAPRRARWVLLAIMVLGWLPGDIMMYLAVSRYYAPFREIGRLVERRANPADLVLVHSIPPGVIALARYLPPDSPLERGAGLASWVGQLGVRRVPDDLRALIDDRRRVIFVRIHDVDQPAPEQDWLMRNARLVGEDKLQFTPILYFAPPEGSATFATDR